MFHVEHQMNEPWQMEGTGLTADGVRVPVDKRKQERRRPLNYLTGQFTEDEVRLLRQVIERERTEEGYWKDLKDEPGVITPKGEQHG